MKTAERSAEAAQSVQMKAVMAAIRRCGSFLVSSHVNPEGDALGSALALASLLKRLGKRATVANQGGIPKAFDFFPRLAPVIAGPSGGRFSPEAAITVDVPLLSRTGSIAKLIEKAPLRINIDHHVSNQRFGHVNWVDPEAAAVGEMIWRLYRAFRLRPTRDEALCMYVSIVTDTGSFRYRSTTPAVHRIAAGLIETGVSPLQVAQDLYECHSGPDLRFLGRVLSGLKQSDRGRVAWVEVPYALFKKCRPGPEIVDELVNYPRAVRTAEVAFVMRQQEPAGPIRVSFRSKGRVNVDALARRFGGGGHMAASGCRLDGTLARARSRILRAVREVLPK